MNGANGATAARRATAGHSHAGCWQTQRARRHDPHQQRVHAHAALAAATPAAPTTAATRLPVRRYFVPPASGLCLHHAPPALAQPERFWSPLVRSLVPALFSLMGRHCLLRRCSGSRGEQGQ